MEFPGVFVPGSNDYYAPRFKNPASYLFGPSKLRGGSKPQPKPSGHADLHAGFGMAGWMDLTNRNQSVVLKGIRFDFTGVDDPHLSRERYAGWPRGSTTRQRLAPARAHRTWPTRPTSGSWTTSPATART